MIAIAIAVTGWALLGGAAFGLVAAETWRKLRGAARSRRHPAAGPTARDLAALAALPPGLHAESEVGELICLLCQSPVDYDVRQGLFCPDCEPAAAGHGAGLPIGISIPRARQSPDGAVLELFHDGMAGQD